jgi:hypothetical protein
LLRQEIGADLLDHKVYRCAFGKGNKELEGSFWIHQEPYQRSHPHSLLYFAKAPLSCTEVPDLSISFFNLYIYSFAAFNLSCKKFEFDLSLFFCFYSTK